jgi:hypothetical protein
MKTLPMRHALGKARAAWEAAHPGLPPARWRAGDPAWPRRRRRLAAARARVHAFAAGAWTTSLAAATVVAHEASHLGAELAGALETTGDALGQLGWGAMSVAVASGAHRWRRGARRAAVAGGRARLKPLAMVAALAGGLAWQLLLA